MNFNQKAQLSLCAMLAQKGSIIYTASVQTAVLLLLKVTNQTVNDGVAHSRIGTLDQPVAA